MTGSLVLRVALLGALAGCGEAAPPPEPVRPVLTIEVIPISKEIFGPFAGTVAARYQTQLGFQTSGRIVARDVYVGDIVVKGQRLAALDPILARLSLTRAKADVVDAKAQLTNAEHVLEREKILAAEANRAAVRLGQCDRATRHRQGKARSVRIGITAGRATDGLHGAIRQF